MPLFSLSWSVCRSAYFTQLFEMVKKDADYGLIFQVKCSVFLWAESDTCILAAGGVTSRNNFIVECKKSSVWCCCWCSFSFEWRDCCRLFEWLAPDFGVDGADVQDQGASDEGNNSSGVSLRSPIVNFVSVRIFLLPMTNKQGPRLFSHSSRHDPIGKK